MTPTYTIPMPLSFWVRQSSRLKDEIRMQEARVIAAAAPIQVTVDGKNDADRIAAATQTMNLGLQRLDSLRALDWTLSDQLFASQFHNGVHGLQSRIDFYAQHNTFYSAFVQDRLSRDAAKQSIANQRAAYTDASKPASGEWGAAERGRLLSAITQLPVFSAEDTAPYLQSNQALRNQLDQLQAQLDSLMATTLLSLVLGPDVLSPIIELGIELMPPVAAAPEIEPLVAVA